MEVDLFETGDQYHCSWRLMFTQTWRLLLLSLQIPKLNFRNYSMSQPQWLLIPRFVSSPNLNFWIVLFMHELWECWISLRSKKGTGKAKMIPHKKTSWQCLLWVLVKEEHSWSRKNPFLLVARVSGDASQVSYYFSCHFCHSVSRDQKDIRNTSLSSMMTILILILVFVFPVLSFRLSFFLPNDSLVFWCYIKKMFEFSYYLDSKSHLFASL
jgi:hypothetical protein